MGNTINQYWWVAITAECMLNYHTGLINRQGSPFAQFRKFFPMCPRKKVEALFWMEQLAIDNSFPLTPSFNRHMKILHKKYQVEWIHTNQ